MTHFQTTIVPFKLIGNTLVLTDQQIDSEPWLKDFISSFKTCFEYDDAMACHVYRPGGA